MLEIPSSVQERVELACIFKRVKIIAPADMSLADENLRHRGPAIGANGHSGLRFATSRNVDLFIVYALFLQKVER
jgi:hypothetical protein